MNIEEYFSGIAAPILSQVLAAAGIIYLHSRSRKGEHFTTAKLKEISMKNASVKKWKSNKKTKAESSDTSPWKDAVFLSAIRLSGRSPPDSF